MFFAQPNNIKCLVWGLMLQSIILIFILSPVDVMAQRKLTLSGMVKDSVTGETLAGASIKITDLANAGSITNNYGFYSVALLPGSYVVQASYVGYKPTTVNLLVKQNLSYNFALSPSGILNIVQINANATKDNNVLTVQPGVDKLNSRELSSVPVLLGEQDIIKSIELLPGVKTTGDANTGFYVRGGGADENLILLDGAPVYNASHLFGFFSTFNADAIKDVSLYKGGIPAQFGGRLSSVLDISMDEGNNQSYVAEGGIGLIASRLKIEGPIVKGKSSFMLSARRTYADAFLKLSADSTLNQSSLYFYDVNAKLNYRFNNNNALYVSAYLGKDNVSLAQDFGTNWGNATATIRYNHLFGSRLFSNTSLIYSKFDYNLSNLSKSDYFSLYSKIEDLSLKCDLEYFIKPGNTLKFGASAVHHDLVPGNINSTPNSGYNSIDVQSRHAAEFAAYLSDEWQLNARLNLVYGIRVNDFVLLGPGTFNTYNADGQITNVSTFAAGQIVQNYFNAEPRIALNYVLNTESSVKASYNLNTQNIHQLSNSTASLPTDVYVMSSNNIKPSVSNQLSTGYFRNFNKGMFEFSVEVYYKWLANEIDYRNNAQLTASDNLESELLYGTGRAYGTELFLKKKYGKFTGWVGYTLSRTERSFAAIDNGNYFPARQDRTHDISIVQMYKINKRLTLSSVFLYETGNAVTYPSAKYVIGGITTYYYASRNASRLPSNNHLDLGATIDGKAHRNWHSSFTFSIYNIYNRKNPYSVIFRDSNSNPPHTEAVETSLFGIIPSVTWNFKFM